MYSYRDLLIEFIINKLKMIHKLIRFLQAILIGLSIIMIQFSCILSNFDPTSTKYTDRYFNDSNKEITLVFTDSISGERDFKINAGEYIDRVDLAWDFTDVDTNTIEDYINELYGTKSNQPIIQLIVDNKIIKSWNGPPNFMGGNNNPFNYNSWTINNEKMFVQFKITENDLK